MVDEQELTFIFMRTVPKMVYGRDAIASLWEELETLNKCRAMIVCGPNILRKSNVITRVQEALREKYIGLFSEVQPHAPVEIVTQGAEVAKGLEPDVLISVGGGSTHDTCKGIVTVLGEGKDIRDCMVKFEPPDKFIEPSLPNPKMPIVAVPTTFGCSEFSGVGGFSDKKLKRKLKKGNDKKTVPKVIVFDGLALATTPVSIHLPNGMSQLRVCIEKVYSKQHNPISDALAIHGIKLLMELLPHCDGGDVDVLLRTKIAGSLPYFGPRAGNGLSTAMGQEIGAIHNVAHGIAMAIMLPYTMRFNLDASAERQALIAQALGIDTSGLSDMEAGLAAAGVIAALSRQFGLPARLRDIGMQPEELELVAQATMHHGTMLSNPKAADQAQVLELLRTAW
ncbi:iron-containing alcohol dehydrogenase [Chloroflexota bacterium]